MQYVKYMLVEWCEMCECGCNVCLSIDVSVEEVYMYCCVLDFQRAEIIDGSKSDTMAACLF